MKISELFVDHHVKEHPEVLSIATNLNITPVIVNNVQELFNYVESADDPFIKSKQFLFLTENRGPFIKKCPGTRSYICCGYKILHIGAFCIMDCTYCILQSYFHPPMLKYFVNHENMVKDLDLILKQKKINRIGTGEFTDSMIWDYWTDLSKTLIKKFAFQTYSVLEMKTKSINIDKLKNQQHNKKTIISWSVNTERVIEREEHNTASLQSRLNAAKKCESWGYPIAFHFDPIIIYDGCEKDYENVVEKIFLNVSYENIVWISLGTFRFIPSLKNIIQKRFPDSKIVYGEFIQGLDNKLRYFKPLRINIYRKIIKKIREIAPEVLIYFCMEDNEIWEKSLGFIPSERGGLSRMLDKSAIRHCELSSPA